MTKGYEFALVPLEELHAHEEIDEADVPALAEEIRTRGVFDNPIWVARGSHVILNGHHRVAALRRLGAHRVAAWVFDYHSPVLILDRWSPGPTISKHDVEERGREGRLYPPKTTKHVITIELPEHHTPLADLLAPAPGPASHRRASAPARAGGGASRSG
jgi:L-serine kinase (ADP)